MDILALVSAVMPSEVAIQLSRESTDKKFRRIVASFHNDKDVVSSLSGFCGVGDVKSLNAKKRSASWLRALASWDNAPADVLSHLASHENERVRLAAWSNPQTPSSAVLAALADPSLDVWGSPRHGMETFYVSQAAAVTLAHPGAVSFLAGHNVSSVRNGAVAFGDFTGREELAQRLSQTFTGTISSFSMNPTVPRELVSRFGSSRDILDSVLAGGCAESVVSAASGSFEAKKLLGVGSPFLDIQLAQKFPVEVVCFIPKDPTPARQEVLPPVLARACSVSPAGCLTVSTWHSYTRVKVASSFSCQLHVMSSCSFVSCDIARVLEVSRSCAVAASLLGDSIESWRTWLGLLRPVSSLSGREVVDLAAAARAAC